MIYSLVERSKINWIRDGQITASDPDACFYECWTTAISIHLCIVSGHAHAMVPEFISSSRDLKTPSKTKI